MALTTRPPGLALAATIAGGDADDDADGANPFLAADGEAAADTDGEAANPFLEEGAAEPEEVTTP